MNAGTPSRRGESPEQQQNGTFTLSGTLKKDRTGFSFTSNGVNAYDSKTMNAALPEQHIAGSVRRPADRANFSARVDHALTKSHTLRASYQRNGTASRQPRRRRLRPCRRAPTRATRRRMCSGLSQSGPGRPELLQRNPLPGAPPDRASRLRSPTRRRCRCSTPSPPAARRSRADAAAPTSSSRPTSTTPRAATRRAPASCSKPAAIAATTRATWAGRSRSPASTPTRLDGRRPSRSAAAIRSSSTRTCSSAVTCRTTCASRAACR